MNISFSAGEKLYKYQLVRKIGGGNFSEVWIARDNVVSKCFAIKILDESIAPVKATLKEAQIGHCLNHSNVVHVHSADVVKVNSSYVAIIVMDYHSAGSIIGKLNPSNFLAITQAVKIIIDILRGLEYLHEQGLYHNDIKPSNILIGQRDEGILTDYGISGLSPNLQPTKAPNAYVLHRAPETSTDNNISIQTDIYQVGLTFFRLVNGIGLIRERRASLGTKRFEEIKAQNKIIQNRDFQLFVPPSIKRIILKAAQADPSDRYQSALGMRRALEAIPLHGHWTTDSNGTYIGYCNNQSFRYEMASTPKGFKFTPYRKRIGSEKENKVSAKVEIALLEKDLNKCKQKFMLDVVKGSV